MSLRKRHFKEGYHGWTPPSEFSDIYNYIRDALDDFERISVRSKSKPASNPDRYMSSEAMRGILRSVSKYARQASDEDLKALIAEVKSFIKSADAETVKLEREIKGPAKGDKEKKQAKMTIGTLYRAINVMEEIVRFLQKDIGADKSVPEEESVLRNRHHGIIEGSDKKGYSQRIKEKYGLDRGCGEHGSMGCGCSEKNQSCAGWSHRAVSLFKKGDKIFDPDFGDDNTPFNKHGENTIRTLDDAMKAAAAFSDYVG